MIRVLRTTVRAITEGTDAMGGLPAFAAPEDVAAARARRDPHAERTLAGRVGLRLLLAHVIGVPAAGARSLSVDRSCPQCGAPHGRPRRSDLSLSSSTSGDQVLAAVAAEELSTGVDVQAPPAEIWPGFDAAVLHPCERRPGDGTGLHARVALWTRKEAVLKAAGVGLRVEPARIRLERHDARSPWWSARADDPGPVRSLLVRDLPGTVPAAVAATAARPVAGVDLAAVLPRDGVTARRDHLPPQGAVTPQDMDQYPERMRRPARGR